MANTATSLRSHQTHHSAYLVPVATCITIVLLAIAYASVLDPWQLLVRPPLGWYGAVLLCFVLAYVATCLGQGTQFVLCRTSHNGAPMTIQSSPRRRPVHVIAASLLAMAVVVEGASHLGSRSGSWVTSTPRYLADTETADGHVFWIEGAPAQSDASFFAVDLNALSGQFVYDQLQVPGRSAYTFLVRLLAPAVTSSVGIYAAFVGVNLAMWWVAAITTYALAERAGAGAFTALATGLLVSTGMGFVFMAGNPMSNVAAYAAVPLMLWTLDGLGVFQETSSWPITLLAAVLCGSLGLLYSLSPFLIGLVMLRFLGRAPLNRIVTWCVAVYGVELVWQRASLMTRWTQSPSEVAIPAIGTAATVCAALVAIRAISVLLDKRRSVDPSGRTLISIVGVVMVVLGVLIWKLNSAVHLVDQAVRAALSLVARVNYLFGGFSTPTNMLATARESLLDLNVAAAFPWTLCPLAIIGMWGLDSRWKHWCLSVISMAVLFGFVYMRMTSIPHPRLLYFGFPAVYILAARGAHHCHRAVEYGLQRFGVPSRLASTCGVLIGTMLLLPAVYTSNASLWGDSTFDLRFHVLNA